MRNIKCAQTGVQRSVDVMLISSHELLQEGGYDYAVKFYTVPDEENDGELKWITDEEEQMVLVNKYFENGMTQHRLIINEQYANEFNNCEIWYEVK